MPVRPIAGDAGRPDPDHARRPGLFCFGLGYTARALAAGLAAEGWEIAGTSRNPATAATTPGGVPLAFARGRPVDPAALAGATHLLVSVPPDAEGDPVLAEHGPALAALPDLRWIGYLSTTGVYGDRRGGWADERSPVAPTGARQQRRAEAEAAWLALGSQAPVQVFRLAGIYGPGRNALETVRGGRAQRVVKPGQVFSRIHRDDIVAVLRASMARPRAGGVYNLADDHPSPPQDVILEACRLLDVTPPPELPFAEAALSAMARSFYADSKRVANARIKAELGVRLRYPDYRTGLAALAATIESDSPATMSQSS